MTRKFTCRFLFVAAPVLLLTGLVAGGLSAQEPNHTRSYSEAFDETLKSATTTASPSVVAIEVKRKPGTPVPPPTRPGRPMPPPFVRGSGPVSGVVLAPDGFIITSLFNVEGELESIKVRLPDGAEADAELLGVDKSRNIALLKVEADGLPVLEPVSEDDVRVGQWVLTLGRSFPGEEAGVALGIISAVNRISGRAIQTDADVGPENYGGALVDVEGRLVAILTPMTNSARSEAAVALRGSGIGFAVPIGDILAELDRLKAREVIRPAFLGIRFNTTMLRGGARVEAVLPDTGAEAAGLKAEDTIIEFDGKAITTPFQLLHAIGSRSTGDVVNFKVKRGEETLTLTVTLGARPDDI